MRSNVRRGCHYLRMRHISAPARANRASRTNCRNDRESAPFGPSSQQSPRCAPACREFPASRNHALRPRTEDTSQCLWVMSCERSPAWELPENCQAEACCLPPLRISRRTTRCGAQSAAMPGHPQVQSPDDRRRVAVSLPIVPQAATTPTEPRKGPRLAMHSGHRNRGQRRQSRQSQGWR